MRDKEEVICPCGAHWTWEQLLNGECPKFPPPFAAAAKRDKYGDIRHRERGLVTTSTVGGCPRATAFSRLRAEPVIVGRKVPMMVGTGLHSWMARQEVAGWTSEYCSCPKPLPLSPEEREQYALPMKLVTECRGGECHEQTCGRLECTFEAEVTHRDQAVRMSGRVDAFYRTDEGLVLVDWKIRNPNARKWADDAAKKDATQQLLTMQIARLQGVKVAWAEVWTCYFYEWRKHEFRPLGDEEFDRWLDTRLPDDERTVWEAILEQHDATMVRTLDEARELPARGEKMFGGKKCSMYCEWEAVCKPEKYDV